MKNAEDKKISLHKTSFYQLANARSLPYYAVCLRREDRQIEREEWINITESYVLDSLRPSAIKL